MTGHLLGGAGGLEAGITALAFATRSCRRPSITTTPIRTATWITFPTRPAMQHLEYALSNSFGFGGTNAALLFKRYTG